MATADFSTALDPSSAIASESAFLLPFTFDVVARAHASSSFSSVNPHPNNNAIVSALATASKTSLLCAVTGAIGQLKWCWFEQERKLYDLQALDEASRGPAGSLALLFRSGLRLELCLCYCCLSSNRSSSKF